MQFFVPKTFCRWRNVSQHIFSNVITNPSKKTNVQAMDFINFTENETRSPKPFQGIEIVNFIKTDINPSFRGLKRKFNENTEDEQNIVKDLKG